MNTLMFGTSAMIGKVTAIVAAAAGAGLIVTVLPGSGPDATDGATQVAELKVAAVASDAPTALTTPPPAAATDEPALITATRPACERSWPYYEPTCLHDARNSDGTARPVRIVVPEQPRLVVANHVAEHPTRPVRTKHAR
jgi:hypothetical protein